MRWRRRKRQRGSRPDWRGDLVNDNNTWRLPEPAGAAIGLPTAEEIVVSVGEYLGTLPYSAPEEEFETVATFMRAGSLIRLGPGTAEILAHCRVVRTGAEIVALLESERSVATHADWMQLVEAGLVRSGSPETVADWLDDCVVRPSGRSRGLKGEGLGIERGDGQVFAVSGVYYWFWLYARTGQSIREVRRFLTQQAHVDAASDADVAGTVLHMLLHGLGRLDLSADAPPA